MKADPPAVPLEDVAEAGDLEPGAARSIQREHRVLAAAPADRVAHRPPPVRLPPETFASDCASIDEARFAPTPGDCWTLPRAASLRRRLKLPVTAVDGWPAAGQR